MKRKTTRRRYAPYLAPLLMAQHEFNDAVSRFQFVPCGESLEMLIRAAQTRLQEYMRLAGPVK